MKKQLGSLALLPALAAVATLSGHAGAADGTIYACLSVSGRLRVVPEGLACPRGETPISWNQMGPPGPPGDAAAPIESKPHIVLPAPTSRFEGFTEATFTGAAGVFAFQSACANEFPHSRWCSSEDILASGEVPDLSGAGASEAWVQPKFVAVSAAGALDASGVTALATHLTCNQVSATEQSGAWGSAEPSGLSVSTGGVFASRECSVARSVACCRNQ